MIEYNYIYINQMGQSTKAAVEYCEVERAFVINEGEIEEHVISREVLERKEYLYDSVLTKDELDRQMDAELTLRRLR